MNYSKSPMEGIYRRVTARTFADAKFMALSPLLASGQALWLYLLTGPHTGPIPGVFVIGKAAMAEVLGWGLEDFEKAFGEVFGQALFEFDAKTRLWFIPNAIRHNAPANPNVVLSWRGPWALLPECPMRDRIAERLLTSLSGISPAFGKAFEEASGKALPKHSPKQRTENREQRTTPKAPGKPGRVSGAYSESFNAIWDTYPNHSAKANASKAFDKLNPSPDLVATIKAAIATQSAWPAWIKDGGSYVPHLATWLNSRRWEDEAPAGASLVPPALGAASRRMALHADEMIGEPS